MGILNMGKNIKKMMDENLKNYSTLDKYFAGNKEVTKEEACKCWESLKEIQTRMASFGLKRQMK